MRCLVRRAATAVVRCALAVAAAAPIAAPIAAQAPPSPPDTATRGILPRLPIWGEQARARGEVIPLAFGVGLQLMAMREPQQIRELRLGLGGGPPVNFAPVRIDRVDAAVQSAIARVDLWLLPFLNVYGLGGQTRGTAEVEVVVALSPTRPLLLPIERDFHGTTLGAGTTLVLPLGPLFGMIDANGSQTALDIAEGRRRALVVDTRIGRRLRVRPRQFASAWVGAMYQWSDETITGRLSIAGAEPVDYEVDRFTRRPWNAVLGGQYEFGPHWHALVEIGVGDRRQAMLGLTWRP